VSRNDFLGSLLHGMIDSDVHAPSNSKYDVVCSSGAAEFSPHRALVPVHGYGSKAVHFQAAKQSEERLGACQEPWPARTGLGWLARDLHRWEDALACSARFLGLYGPIDDCT